MNNIQNNFISNFNSTEIESTNSFKDVKDDQTQTLKAHPDQQNQKLNFLSQTECRDENEHLELKLGNTIQNNLKNYQILGTIIVFNKLNFSEFCQPITDENTKPEKYM